MQQWQGQRPNQMISQAIVNLIILSVWPIQADKETRLGSESIFGQAIEEIGYVGLDAGIHGGG